MISTNFFPNEPVPPVTSIDSCDQLTILVPSKVLLPVKHRGNAGFVSGYRFSDTARFLDQMPFEGTGIEYRRFLQPARRICSSGKFSCSIVYLRKHR